MLFAMLAVSFAMQAQSKFHDVELNQATGPVKKIVSNMMGREQIINFTQDGKMQQEGMSDAVYNEEGYMQSAKISIQGQDVEIKYTWENGKVASQSLNVMGNDMTVKYTYNEKGAPAADMMNMGGQEMSMPYTDYKYDDHGNWISRKSSMMGQEMEQKRTIEYYE